MARSEIDAALSLQRPFCYHTDGLDDFNPELDKVGHIFGRHADQCIGDERQLGKARE